MIFRSKAPLRISLAGGGTDLREYADVHGGAVLNTTIDLYAHASITPRCDDRIVLHAVDQCVRQELDAKPVLDIDGRLDLAKAVYNRIVEDYNEGVALSFDLKTCVDAPPGSGLGSSSTLVAAMIGAFVAWLRLPLGEYDIAKLACQIERDDLGFAGGLQDQYAATFGGWNFMEFARDKVIVNPLRIRSSSLQELEFNLVLYYTGTSRISSSIIAHQIDNIQNKSSRSLKGLNQLKEQAFEMKEALLTGQLGCMGENLAAGWQSKKATADHISNDEIERIYEAALKSGASGGKISGAGGGGYMMFFCPGDSRYKVIETLRRFGGRVDRLEFSKGGLTTWAVK